MRFASSNSSETKMAINPLQLTGFNSVNNAVDPSQWSSLGNLGNVYQKAQQEQANKAAFALYQQTGDPKALIGSGDQNLAQLGINAQNHMDLLKQQAIENKRSESHWADEMKYKYKALDQADKPKYHYTTNEWGETEAYKETDKGLERVPLGDAIAADPAGARRTRGRNCTAIVIPGTAALTGGSAGRWVVSRTAAVADSSPGCTAPSGPASASTARCRFACRTRHPAAPARAANTGTNRDTPGITAGATQQPRQFPQAICRHPRWPIWQALRRRTFRRGHSRRRHWLRAAATCRMLHLKSRHQ